MWKHFCLSFSANVCSHWTRSELTKKIQKKISLITVPFSFCNNYEIATILIKGGRWLTEVHSLLMGSKCKWNCRSSVLQDFRARLSLTRFSEIIIISVKWILFGGTFLAMEYIYHASIRRWCKFHQELISLSLSFPEISSFPFPFLFFFFPSVLLMEGRRSCK